VGSDGTIDESDRDLYDVVGAHLRVASVGNVVARYNVEPVPGLFEAGNKTFLRVLFRDDGPSSRVRVTLRQSNVFTLQQTVLLSFDSDNYPASVGLRLQEVANCPGFTFDFDNNVYWIEALLERTANPIPRLAAMQIGQTVC
jgi:hypothetical protein